jgi:nucleoside-diphosphate-sugar epimerase
MTTSDLHVVFGTGQVGSQLVDRLLARGYRVRTGPIGRITAFTVFAVTGRA